MRYLPLAALLIASPVLAQQPPAPQADFESAISAQVAAEHWAFLKANANLEVLGRQLADLKNQVAALRAENEKLKIPPKAEPPKPLDAAPAR